MKTETTEILAKSRATERPTPNAERFEYPWGTDRLTTIDVTNGRNTNVALCVIVALWQKGVIEDMPRDFTVTIDDQKFDDWPGVTEERMITYTIEGVCGHGAERFWMQVGEYSSIGSTFSIDHLVIWDCPRLGKHAGRFRTWSGINIGSDLRQIKRKHFAKTHTKWVRFASAGRHESVVIPKNADRREAKWACFMDFRAVCEQIHFAHLNSKGPWFEVIDKYDLFLDPTRDGYVFFEKAETQERN